MENRFAVDFRCMDCRRTGADRRAAAKPLDNSEAHPGVTVEELRPARGRDARAE